MDMLEPEVPIWSLWRRFVDRLQHLGRFGIARWGGQRPAGHAERCGRDDCPCYRAGFVAAYDQADAIAGYDKQDRTDWWADG